MKPKHLKRHLVTASLLFTALLALSHVWLLGSEFKVHGGEAFESPDDFEDAIGFVEWDSWGNFSAAPDMNPPPSLALSAAFLSLSPAQRLLSAGKCSAIEIHETYLLANFKLGTKAYVQYSVNRLRQVTKMELGIAPMKILAGTEDEGGWELSDKDISLIQGSEEDLVERGPSMAGFTRNIITIRPNGSEGMAFDTMPTKSNYTLDNKATFYGYGLEAGGDQSLNDIGEAIAEASGVEFYNVVNSTQILETTHKNEENVIELAFVTYDDWSSAALAGKALGSMSIISRFVNRIGVAAGKVKDFAKSAAGTTYKGAAFIAGKAKTVVSTVAKTAVNTLKAGVTFIPNLLKGLSKWILIPIIGVCGIVVIFVLKKYKIL